MGMYLDKYVGYVMDIEEEIQEVVKDGRWDYFFETYVIDDNPIPESLKKLGLKTRYDEEGLEKGDAELLIDNVSGKFSYIIIIEQVERWADDYSVESPLVLEAMAKQPVSSEISDRIKEIYKILFGKETDKSIYLTKVNHYH